MMHPRAAAMGAPGLGARTSGAGATVPDRILPDTISTTVGHLSIEKLTFDNLDFLHDGVVALGAPTPQPPTPLQNLRQGVSVFLRPMVNISVSRHSLPFMFPQSWVNGLERVTFWNPKQLGDHV